MNPIAIMINGLPGKVAYSIAYAASQNKCFTLIPFSLTGSEINDTFYPINDQKINLIKPDNRKDKIKEILREYPKFISIDFTHPTAVNENAKFYTENSIPFVMGTTGGNRLKLEQTVNQSNICAVIAPNMAKQIVGLQAMMEYATKEFPGLFSGYKMEVKESHQKNKADTSGTAKAMVGYFNKLGVKFQEKEICQTRDPEIQEKEWKIPKEHLDGHAWHTYSLRSKDGSVLFEFTHNVNGRNIYVDGTLDAVNFLWKKLNHPENKGRVFTMIDVLGKK